VHGEKVLGDGDFRGITAPLSVLMPESEISEGGRQRSVVGVVTNAATGDGRTEKDGI
jgi:hypothetical protein